MFDFNFPIVSIFIAFGVTILILTFYNKVRKSDNNQRENFSSFVEAEREANFARRKDPKPEDYLTVNIHTLPMREYPDEQAYSRAASRQKKVIELAGRPMIRDVQHMSNRELKLKFGTANLDTIITYEENYNQFIHNLLEWADALADLGQDEKSDAALVLKSAIEYGCDRSQAYTMLADFICDRDELALLREKAKDTLEGSAAERTLAYIENRERAIT